MYHKCVKCPIIIFSFVMILSGCATGQYRHAYVGDERPIEELATLRGSSQKSLFPPKRNDAFIQSIDNVNVVYRDSSIKDSFLLTPGKHKINLSYYFLSNIFFQTPTEISGNILANLECSFEANKTYIAKVNYLVNRSKIANWIEEETTKKVICENESSESSAKLSDQESIYMANLINWEVGHQSENKSMIVTEWVRPGETVDNWTELFTLVYTRKSSDPRPLDKFVEDFHQRLFKNCPDKITWEIIDQKGASKTDYGSVLAEWTVRNCSSVANQHELTRIIYGEYNIGRLSFTAKVDTLDKTKREEWIKHLLGASYSLEDALGGRP